MKNIFVLTKSEQRIVIVFIMILLAVALAKRYRDTRLPAPPITSISSPAPTISYSPDKPGTRP
jgi:hypothetical protein